MATLTSEEKEPPLQIGYWKIRGLAAALRMTCTYAGAEYESVEYVSKPKEGGGYDTSEWHAQKRELATKNALINLPYVLDGETLVTQSNACLYYLGRKFRLAGVTALEQMRVDEALCQVMDLRNETVRAPRAPPLAFAHPRIPPPLTHDLPRAQVGLVYGKLRRVPRESALDLGAGTHLAGSVQIHYMKLEGYMQSNDTRFLCADHPTVADFHMCAGKMADEHERLLPPALASPRPHAICRDLRWEMIDQHERMARWLGVKSPLTGHGCLAALYNKLRTEPKLAPYFASEQYALPQNSPMAGYGGTIDDGRE